MNEIGLSVNVESFYATQKNETHQIMPEKVITKKTVRRPLKKECPNCNSSDNLVVNNPSKKSTSDNVKEMKVCLVKCTLCNIEFCGNLPN